MYRKRDNSYTITLRLAKKEAANAAKTFQSRTAMGDFHYNGNIGTRHTPSSGQFLFSTLPSSNKINQHQPLPHALIAGVGDNSINSPYQIYAYVYGVDGAPQGVPILIARSALIGSGAVSLQDDATSDVIQVRYSAVNDPHYWMVY